jgi:UPF0755 protein
LPRRLWLVLAALALLLLLAVVVVRHVYTNNLKPVSASQKIVLITIPLGSTAHEIAVNLQTKGIIRQAMAFEWYVRSHEVRDKLQAGTYALRPSQNVAQIVSILTQGKIDVRLVTIPPGRRLDEIRSILINDGFGVDDVDKALNPALYVNHPVLVEKPADIKSLEGYLYPESFQKAATTKPQSIINLSLDEMQKRLTPEVRNAIVKQNLTVYQGLVLASIVEKEVAKPEDKVQVAQVFLKRLRAGMPLEADSTAIYGAVLADQPPSITYDSVYNTYKHPGLPPTPISNITESSLRAVAFPATTDWLYFVSGDDCKTYFSRTLAEHEALTAQHYKKGCVP